ncbi:MAG: LysM peptidoglycan-binding domain-containing protein [Phycisphaerales bacterium]|nr:LysM peptidoglycan-binding domain-containing protein [Phycisphaerales bacterium]
MKLARSYDDAPDPVDRPDAIEGWLDMLVRVLRLPDDDRTGIRDELEGHLRERVRDLMVTGMPEGEATRTAIGELGDAATLASRFEHARRPRRRHLMHAAIFTILGAGLTTGILAVQGGATPPTIVPPVSSLPEGIVQHRLSIDEGEPLRDVLESLAATSGHALFIHTNVLESEGVSLDEPLTFSIDNAAASTAMRLVNESLDIHPPIEMRLIDGMLEVATRDYFDQLETVITMYDLEAALPANDPDAREYRAGQIAEAVQELVETECWVDYGGSVASIHLVDHRMFVSAPPRMQSQVAWILDLLKNDTAVVSDGFREPAPVTGVSTETHVVREGDSLHRIAASRGVSMEDLVRANPGVTDHPLRVGQSLNFAR